MTPDAPPRTLAARREAAERFDVRHVHPTLRFGSASDRDAAWIGPVYPRDVWADQVTTRAKRVGAQSVQERLLPVASVEDYFLKASVLELDFPYYRPLVEPTGKPSPGLFTLQQYADHAPHSARFLLKAPQAFTARRVRRTVDGRVQYVENPEYLDAAAYFARFLEPAYKSLGVKLAGVIFEQPYERARESPPPEQLVDELDGFVNALPEGPLAGVPMHVEIRSPHLHAPVLAEWMHAAGVGMSLSHWQWLPPLIDQWRFLGERFPTREAVVRLMQPREMTYEQSFLLAHPFEAPVPALSATPDARRMVDETTALMFKAIEQGVTLNVIGNNRAWGHTPDLWRTLARRFFQFAERRGVVDSEPGST